MPRDEQPGDGDAWYKIGEPIKERQLARQACDAVLRALAHRVAIARLDVHTDYSKVITADALAAEERLEELVKVRDLRDITIDLNLSNAEDADLFHRYLPWSINVDLYNPLDQLIANFHDCAYSIVMRLSPEHASQLAAELQGLATVKRAAPFEPWPRTPLKHRRSRRKRYGKQA
jgi:hypothetical protein